MVVKLHLWEVINVGCIGVSFLIAGSLWFRRLVLRFRASLTILLRLLTNNKEKLSYICHVVWMVYYPFKYLISGSLVLLKRSAFSKHSTLPCSRRKCLEGHGPKQRSRELAQTHWHSGTTSWVFQKHRKEAVVLVQPSSCYCKYILFVLFRL